MIRDADAVSLQEMSNLLEAAKSKPIVYHPISKFIFEVPVGMAEKQYWTSFKDPPFFNRHDAVFHLLSECYSNYIDKTPKPSYSISIAAPGFGKTRLLMEWAIRVFHMPVVFTSFLLGLSALDKQQTPIKLEQLMMQHEERKNIYTALWNISDEVKLADIEHRVKFLGQLHKTLRQGRILTTAAILFVLERDVDPGKLSKEIVARAIQHCFTKIRMPNGSVFDAQQPTYQMVEKFSFNDLFGFYLAGGDQTPYEEVFPGTAGAKPIMLVNIDECQV